MATPSRASRSSRRCARPGSVIRADSVTSIEPNHRPPLHTPDHDPRLSGTPDLSNSQHPGNNVVPNEQYDGYNEGTDTDFQRAEALIAPVYEALRDPARAVRPPQPGQLGPLGLGQLAGIAARAGLRQPVAERPLVHPEVSGALRDRLTRLDHILDGALTEAVIEPSSCLWAQPLLIGHSSTLRGILSTRRRARPRRPSAGAVHRDVDHRLAGARGGQTRARPRGGNGGCRRPARAGSSWPGRAGSWSTQCRRTTTWRRRQLRSAGRSRRCWRSRP